MTRPPSAGWREVYGWCHVGADLQECKTASHGGLRGSSPSNPDAMVEKETVTVEVPSEAVEIARRRRREAGGGGPLMDWVIEVVRLDVDLGGAD